MRWVAVSLTSKPEVEAVLRRLMFHQLHCGVQDRCKLRLSFISGVVEQPFLQTGFTVILVERSEGVETKPIKTSYSSSAGTAYITFDNVKVPVENTLGPEGGGIFVILSCVSFSTSRKRLLTQLYSNFNHERWVMCTSSARGQRLIVEECLKFVHSFPFKYFFLSLANCCHLLDGSISARHLANPCLLRP
jgi:hypothetical protein